MSGQNSYAHLLPPSWKQQVAAWLQPAVLAGSPFVTEIFAQLGCEVEWHVKEGDVFEPVKHIATVKGKARFLLLGERIALNLLARCSGIATNGWIDPHRHDLSSMIMLKDNHIWSSGSITAAIQQARQVGGFSLLLDRKRMSHSAGADIIMLDNIEGAELVNVARSLKEKWKGQRKFLFETSGNITEANLQERAINDIDILSTSVVHQSVQHMI
ncbi:Quinolinate phosphoribosyl transferase [Pholiota molesta]|nr:Quinolinate phosphoribosyl transferase [Pholiota molesta]